MRDLSLFHLNDAALMPALKPAFPKLFLGTTTAIISGLAMLFALWGTVQLIAQLSFFWVVFSILFWILGALFAALSSWLVHEAEAQFSARLRREVANHLTRLPATTLSKQGNQHLKRLISEDIATLHYMIAHLPAEAAIFAIIPLASIVVLVTFVGPAALWILLPGAVASLYYLVIVPYVSKRDGAARMQVMLDIIESADNYARGIRDNRIYGQQSGALIAYAQSAQDFTQRMVSWVAKVATLAALATALLQAVATFALAYWVAYPYDDVTLAIALLFSLAIVTPALRLAHGLDYVSAGKKAADRLSVFLRQPKLPYGNIQQVKGDLLLEIVNAKYSINDQVVFDQFSYQFPAQSLTAITGPSGSGKTTLMRLLAGLIVLEEGSVQLAKTDLSKWHEQLKHEKILFIAQGADVLAATVRENLTLALSSIDDHQLKQALAIVQLEIDLDADAMLLSGGEKQRIGIARAFLSSASVILLDEPSSALDDNNTKNLMQQLQQLAKQHNKTVVIVTHDLLFASEADHQLVLNRIV